MGWRYWLIPSTMLAVFTEEFIRIWFFDPIEPEVYRLRDPNDHDCC